MSMQQPNALTANEVAPSSTLVVDVRVPVRDGAGGRAFVKVCRRRP
jgi:hypothetical protein